MKSLRSAFLHISRFLLLLYLGISLGLLFVYLFGTLPDRDLEDIPRHRTTTLYDRSGTHTLYRLYAEENRIVVHSDVIPDLMRNATLASEDANFYSHVGIDPLSLLRALAVNLSEGKIEQGGSTITQQLARNLFLTRERTWQRKVRELFLALKLERRFSKDEILDLYLNTVPYGSNAYGVESAALTFFGKHIADVTPDEAALLAVLPSAPTSLSPYGSRTDELVDRTHHVLRRMHDLGMLDTATRNRALETRTLDHVVARAEPILAPHFVFAVLDELAQTYDEDTLRTEGFQIRTSLDLELQDIAEHAVATGAERNLSRRAENAGLVALDPRSGEVLAMVGSKDYWSTDIDGKVNVTLRPRQPGSAFKPFVYATAFERGFQPESLVLDAPKNFGPDGAGRDYIPQNYDGKSHGLLTFRQALSMSLNIPAVKVLEKVGVRESIDLATRLGITTLDRPDRYGLSLVLGGADVRPLDMASAFSVFGQEGIRHTPALILDITDRSGKTLFSHAGENGSRVLDAEVSRKINSILSDNAARTPIFGPRSPLAFPTGVAVAAKTGTTQNFRDAWTVGYTPSIAATVWVGNNDYSPMAPGSDGIFVAAPIWRSFMDEALKRFPETGFAGYERRAITRETSLESPEKRVVYIDTKSGKEISEERAKKLSKKKKGRVERREIDPAPTDVTL